MVKVRVGFIGAGSHANLVHYPSLSLMEDVQITAICDLNRERLIRTSEKYGVKKRYTNYMEMIEKENLDAVFVIMPPHHLYDIVVSCLEAGQNVFIEKPPGVTAQQARSLAWYAEKKGCITMVGFNRRFIPLMRKVKTIVEEKGPINQCVSTFYKCFMSENPPYYRGALDILTCDAIHAVDALRWMAQGEVKNVFSSVRSIYYPYNNSFNALIEFDGGAIGILLTNWAAGSRIHTFEMHSKGVSAFVNPDTEAVIYLENNPNPTRISTFEAAKSRERFVYYGFFDEDKHFVDCVRRGKEPETSFRDAVKTMELIERIYSAAARSQH
ncbi:gfo/Idh/MocA family oxidoreductase [Candidatus Bathyarchaeota archaeon]|nr:MAG: gfo/Idh/MocA family oxidoreductase [Candidatus Bathyarchaeota archaeon]